VLGERELFQKKAERKPKAPPPSQGEGPEAPIPEGA
jgi:hypothetical protein